MDVGAVDAKGTVIVKVETDPGQEPEPATV